MKTAISLIAWTAVGGLALTFAFTGHAWGWVGAFIAGAGIKQALWPSSERGEAGGSFNVDAGGCGSCGGGCGGCGGCGG